MIRYRDVCVKPERLVYYLVYEFLLCVTPEGQMAEEHCVVHDSDGPDVDGGRGLTAWFERLYNINNGLDEKAHLWRHVGHRPCIDFVLLFVLTDASDTEVDDLDVQITLSLEKDIL